ncbi:MAG: nucleotide exchange factor GrpE [Ignavibacteriae bacterium]|nr:nucleotide exchange factor GrpE [Ignavibacteriota bacterium]
MAENTNSEAPGTTPEDRSANTQEPAQASSAPDESAKVIETLRDQLLRKAAEFENYKRRTEGEFLSLTRTANEGLLLSLLPVLDDLNRSLASGKDPQSHEAFFAGVEMIRTKFLKILEKHGVVPFPSTGKPFDVGFHDALMQLPRTDVPTGTVIQEVDPGYVMHDKVLRHAKVIVSAQPTEPEDTHGEA